MGLFSMPSLGSDMESARLTEWLVAPGDKLHRGDVVAVVETQKGAIEIEVFEDGIVETLMARPGQVLAVGAPMALIRAPDEVARPTSPDTLLTVSSAPVATKPPSLPALGTKDMPPSSPAARRLAIELGVDLSDIRGSGPGGEVIRPDVERAAEESKPIHRPGFDAAGMRAAISAAMQRSKREIPHYYLSHEIDLQPAADWLNAANAVREPADRILVTALFVKATALAAAQVPEMNGHYAGDGFQPAPEVHAGLVVALRGGGLVAPTITGAAQLPLDALMKRVGDLVSRARVGRLRSSEMTEATLTVSSFGEGGVDAMAGIIFPTQVALVAFGTPRRCARPVGERIEARETVTVTLSADHRVSDGRTGARFLKTIDTLLQDPEAL